MKVRSREKRPRKEGKLALILGWMSREQSEKHCFLVILRNSETITMLRPGKQGAGVGVGSGIGGN